jgi:hypothetical protein
MLKTKMTEHINPRIGSFQSSADKKKIVQRRWRKENKTII